MSEEWLRVTSEQYLDANADVREAKADPLRHALSRVIDIGEPRCLRYPAALDTPEGKAAYWKVWTDVADAKMDPLKHYIRHGWKEGRWPLPGTVIPTPTPTPTPTPGPTPGPVPNPVMTGEIIDFVQVPEFSRAPVGYPRPCAYFTVGKINGKIVAGSYGYVNGKHQSLLVSMPNDKASDVVAFNSESCFCLIFFKGFWYLSVEHGMADSVDKGMIYRFENGKWIEKFRSSHWNLILNGHIHAGRLYFTGCNFDNRSDAAGHVSTVDGEHWDEWTNPNEYRFFGMCSRGSEFWVGATSSGADWGANDCKPSVFCNNNLVWRDESRPNQGHWGIAAFKGDIFIAGTGNARVIRLSDKKEVLTMNGFNAGHHLIVDPVTDTLIGFFGKDATQYSTGARAMATKDGNKWYQINGDFSTPGLFWTYFDTDTNEWYLGAGRFQNGDKGGVYKSVRRS